jgi:hypothetical protein
MDNVKELKETWKKVEKEINRPLTDDEKNIARIAFIQGTYSVYQEMAEEQFEEQLSNHKGPLL